jgi:hypothetical protein
VQTFVAPTGATDPYLGYSDAGGYHGDPGFYGDNSGSVVASYDISSSAPQGLPDQSSTLVRPVAAGTSVIFFASRRQRKASCAA